MDQIVNGIWAICEESFWGVPAHLGLQRAGQGLPDITEPVVDLFAAETGALLAWTYYLLKPELGKINPLITQRIEIEIDHRLLTPYLGREDWGWMGFTYRLRKDYQRPVNNWNPWINSNILTCALLVETDEARRLKLIYKTMDSIDNFLQPYPADGGCDEGPSYWSRAGGSLFDYLELLNSATGGQINIFNQPLIQKMGKYIYRAYISDPYFINFADASAKLRVEPALVFRFGQAIHDPIMQQLAAFTARQEDFGSGAIIGRFGGLNRQLPALFTINDLLATPPVEPLLRDVWLPDIQVMAARSQAGKRDGFYVAAKGGHNDESHNHNDVGNFIVYADGKPVLIDAGAQTYTRKTFSSQRYELWNNQSAYHNVPTINGQMQMPGREFAARNIKYETSRKWARFSLDLAGAYPEEAQVISWQRTITLQRGKRVELVEAYQLKAAEKPIELNFLTPLNPAKSAAGKIQLSNPQQVAGPIYHLVFDTRRWEPEFERIEMNDTRMKQNWGEYLYRIILKSKKQARADKIRIKIEK